MTLSKIKQKTIRRPFVLSGIGMHSGSYTTLNFFPAPENFGITFIINGEEIKAIPENVTDTKLGTTLGKIKVVEHLMAAIAGAEIDNLRIEIQGEEVPILDGSALPYLNALKNAGAVEQDAPKKSLVIKEIIKVKEKEKLISLSPHDGLKITFVVNYPVIGEQKIVFEWDPEVFAKEIAPARTFGYVKDLKELQAQRFALGASLENALAIGENGYMNQPRFEDEPVRHKVLDLIGDLALVGGLIKGEIYAFHSGHFLNLELARKLRRRGEI